ncbi:hypothetical protein SKTS_26770 [Sulfurimicrobium lacus]|uniref:FimV N-terminal domain-containing protein n=2 Tax=Sulfurimicrobium lacus TaxID=2715678 RepID=A0A6F8VF56_9PROT|nr:hypothetical protein SKTS_26770 [Sulfurimicrobium lacus]
MILGDLALHSSLGQPLRASIPVKADKGEQLDDSCFSLVRPERQDDFTYLTRARLALEQVDGRMQLEISSQHAIGEPFARLLIQADCGQGRINRVFTVLLDPEVPASPAPSLPVTEPSVPPVAKSEVAPRKPRKARIAPKPVSSPAAASSPEKMPPEHAPAGGEGEFRLKLSSEGLDLSLLGKMSEDQRRQLREKQRLLDADDQVANTLSMKNRIMQLESQIGELQVALAKTDKHLAMSERLATAPAHIPLQTSPGVLDKWLGGLESLSLRGLAGVSLILALLISVWWRWRRRQAAAWLEEELRQEFSPDVTYSMPSALHGEKRAATAPANNQEDELYHSVTSIFDTSNESVTFTEAESVLDEADLYLAYGWSNRAIELLQEYLEKHPDDVQLWKKLFETYSTLGMKQEFEQLALRCQATMDDSGLRVLVHKLGRQLDGANPLYASSEAENEAPAEAAPPVPELPALDTPLEFVLDDKPSEVKEAQPEALKEDDSLGFDPLFPEPFKPTKTHPESDAEKGS